MKPNLSLKWPMAAPWRVACMAILLAPALLAACSAEPAPSLADSQTLSCASSILSVSALTPDAERFATSVVAFESLPTNSLGKAGSTGEMTAGYMFAKIALLVRSDRAATIEIDQNDEDDVLIEWSSSPTMTVNIPDCGGTQNQWNVYAGGIWVTWPRCVSLAISSDGNVEHLDIPVAALCE